ncbi:helix-turn-helix transcriptional regulator [Amycolatopsis sp. NBC_01488]|uniref:winged helix-turn-helix transcriptional regulator n=1 Tax=Amycolatopsis sp. NBC_01488 TaxID=2903563 RepID=UPI002E281F2E|nr:helix-turn-helix domain-containing protein [Amycolatopsis sp. NBC_01488]
MVTELQNITHGTYGQYCGLARASEMIGERWSLLILRDLLVSPRTVADLRAGLPRISANVLETRLRELEYSGVVRKQGPTREPDQAVYELTEYGRSVEDVMLALSRWGAMALAAPRPEDILTEDSVVMALRSTAHREAAGERKVSFEVRLGEVVVHAVADNGELTVNGGALPGADLVIESSTELKGLLSGASSPSDAIAAGQVTVTAGDPALLDTFVELFHLPSLPEPVRI